MDNRTIDVVSEGQDALAMALALIWPNAVAGKATHFVVANLKDQVRYVGSPPEAHSHWLVPDPAGTPTLILLWHAERDAVPLPFPLALEDVPQFVKGWLRSADYGQEPGHDGSNQRGWRVFTEAWGHVAGYHYAITGIQPAWAMYGK